MKHLMSRAGLAATAGILLAVAPAAFAGGTQAGLTVTNTVNVDYEVSGVNQTDITATTNFRVDRKVVFTVAEVGGAATPVVPGSSNQVLTFRVTNSSNDTLDFRLTATEDGNGTALPFGGTDGFNVATLGTLNVFVESNGTAGYQSGVGGDTATFIDELGIDQQKVVYVVGSFDASLTNGLRAGVTLSARAALNTEADGDADPVNPVTVESDLNETNDGAPDVSTFTDTVFGDVAGDTDGVEDGIHSDDDQYNVVTASLVVTKSLTVVYDPFTGTSANAKPIPGAVIEYCIDVDNTGGAAAASTVIITDAIPANTTYSAGTIKTAATGTGAACDVASGTTEDDGNTGTDEGPAEDGGSYDGTGDSVTVTTPSIAAGSRFKATFRVTVD